MVCLLRCAIGLSDKGILLSCPEDNIALKLLEITKLLKAGLGSQVVAFDWTARSTVVRGVSIRFRFDTLVRKRLSALRLIMAPVAPWKSWGFPGSGFIAHTQFGTQLLRFQFAKIYRVGP
jgi:hypothetical protein